MTLRISVIFFCLLLDFFQKFGYLLLNTVFSPMPGWRNGRRSRLKICFPQGVRVRSPSRVPTFFLRKKKVGQRKTAYRFFEKSLAKTPAVFFYRRGVFFVWLLGAAPLAPLYFWGTLPLDFSQKLLQDDKRKIEKFFCNAISFLC